MKKSDSHAGHLLIDHAMDTIMSRDLPPFRAAGEAGADLLLISSPPEEQAAAYAAVVAAVESGEISRERIDASVERM